MLIKVCGMRQADNILALCGLKPDFIGFIFHEKSPRYAGSILTTEVIESIPGEICKTAVFVNASLDYMFSVAAEFKINAIQLHGNETPKVCYELKKKGLKIIKAFAIENSHELDGVKEFEDICDYFLFDTPSLNFGGSGRKFNWSVLNDYKGKVPYFLSGGIGQGDGNAILNHENDMLAGIDLNSRFEIAPGIKDIEQLALFFKAFNR